MWNNKDIILECIPLPYAFHFVLVHHISWLKVLTWNEEIVNFEYNHYDTG